MCACVCMWVHVCVAFNIIVLYLSASKWMQWMQKLKDKVNWKYLSSNKHTFHFLTTPFTTCIMRSYGLLVLRYTLNKDRGSFHTLNMKVNSDTLNHQHAIKWVYYSTRRISTSNRINKAKPRQSKEKYEHCKATTSKYTETHKHSHTDQTQSHR